jgi:hypothetical protein
MVTNVLEEFATSIFMGGKRGVGNYLSAYIVASYPERPVSIFISVQTSNLGLSLLSRHT